MAELPPTFDATYAKVGRPPIPPERLLKASILIALYSVRSEHQFCERHQVVPGHERRRPGVRRHHLLQELGAAVGERRHQALLCGGAGAGQAEALHLQRPPSSPRRATPSLRGNAPETDPPPRRGGSPAAWALRRACAFMDGLITPATSNLGTDLGPYSRDRMDLLPHRVPDCSAVILKPHRMASCPNPWRSVEWQTAGRGACSGEV